MKILAEISLPEFFLGVAASVVAAIVFAFGVAIYKAGFRPTWSAIRAFCRLYYVLGTIRIRSFIRDRSDYRRFRGQERHSINSYVRRAQRELALVSISLVTGVDFEDLCETLRELTGRESPVRVRISMLNPRNPALMTAISPVLDKTQDQLAENILSTMNRLLDLRATLSKDGMSHLHLYFHNAIPSASAIMIDVRESYGTIQLETKPYKAPLGNSFGFELQNGGSHPLYQTLVTAYDKLINDGEEQTS